MNQRFVFTNVSGVVLVVVTHLLLVSFGSVEARPRFRRFFSRSPSALSFPSFRNSNRIRFFSTPNRLAPASTFLRFPESSGSDLAINIPNRDLSLQTLPVSQDLQIEIPLVPTQISSPVDVSGSFGGSPNLNSNSHSGGSGSVTSPNRRPIVNTPQVLAQRVANTPSTPLEGAANINSARDFRISTTGHRFLKASENILRRSGVTDLNEFGEAWMGPDRLIWGNTIINKQTGSSDSLSYREAAEHCRKIGARLPTRAELDRLFQFMGAIPNTQQHDRYQGYVPQILANLRHNRIWSSSSADEVGPEFMYFVSTENGGLGRLHRDNSSSVTARCVVSSL